MKPQRLIVLLLISLLIVGIHPALTQDSGAHRIGTRLADGQAEFYDTVNGERFVPRGVNYFDLHYVQGPNHYEDRTFAVGDFDADYMRTVFQGLVDDGFNTVRIFLDLCSTGPDCMGKLNGRGLNPDYLDNIATVMQIAAETNIHLLLTSNDLPSQGGYWQISDQGVNDQFGGYRNANYLTAPGVRAAATYWRDLMSGLVKRDAVFEAVLGWELLNEQFYLRDLPPLSLNSGTITTANGQSYDLTDREQKQQMLAGAMVYYIGQMREVIQEYDPDSLITMGFFVPDHPNTARVGDNREVDTAPLLDTAPLDFFDFHAYPTGELTMAQYAQNFGTTGYTAKPILMGETGAFIAQYPTAESAVRAITQWIADSCQYGFGGWLYWGYVRAPEAIGDATWGFTDAGGLMMQTLAPNAHPDPCIPADVPTDNLAYGQRVTASQSLPDQPPGQAVDGGPAQWGAGSHPPQWIEVSLADPSTISAVNLQVAQYPAGTTRHQVWAKLADGHYVLLDEFAETTHDDQILSVTLPAPLANVVAVRVDTLESPSWVSWKEIEVIRGAASETACTVTAGGTVNLRNGPGTSFDSAGAIPAGRGAYVDGQTTGGDGFVWWHLLSGAWVRADVVRASESCDSVPSIEP